jgi:hypothetical protein
VASWLSFSPATAARKFAGAAPMLSIMVWRCAFVKGPFVVHFPTGYRKSTSTAFSSLAISDSLLENTNAKREYSGLRKLPSNMCQIAASAHQYISVAFTVVLFACDT